MQIWDEGITSHLEVEHFLCNDVVAFNILPSDILLLDNAGVYSTCVDVRTALNVVMYGNWDYKSKHLYVL